MSVRAREGAPYPLADPDQSKVRSALQHQGRRAEEFAALTAGGEDVFRVTRLTMDAGR